MGGGTPGILRPRQIACLMETVKKVFPMADNAEITMESSLTDMTEEKMGSGHKSRGEPVQLRRPVLSDRSQKPYRTP